MSNNRKIFLFSDLRLDHYRVERLVNCVEPTVDSLLDKREVERLIARSQTEVTIRRKRR